jgi:serine/threonine-protein kinase
MIKKNKGDIIEFVKQRDYVMVNPGLGSGSFGDTVLMQDPFIDELFVAKKYAPKTDNDDEKEKFYQNFLAEIKIMYKLNHRNIARIYNYYPYPEILTGYIIMEFIDGVTFDKFIEDYEYPFEEWTVTLNDVFSQLIDGFCYIESKKVIHRDIREKNIMIDNKESTVKIIDFGIGKEHIKEASGTDSLHGSQINRMNSDTLPQEYYDGTYSSKTDMFYLGELLNRMFKTVDNEEFKYYHIVEKMINKNPDDRYESFADVREAIDKYDFSNMDITVEDREIYSNFVDSLFSAITCFVDEVKFVSDTNAFITRLEKAYQNNCFADVIQKNADVIFSVVNGKYRPATFLYGSTARISCDDVKSFIDWIKKSNPQSQQLILNNIITKLSTIRTEYTVEDDYPF